VIDSNAAAGGDWLQVGVVAGAMGVHGEVKVDLTTDFPDRFTDLETIYVGPGRRPMRVRRARRHHRRVILALEAVEDRDAAAALQGLPLFVPRAEAVPLPSGHYYHDQILGLQVETSLGEPLGHIVEILVTGSNDVYVVQGERGEVLIPALKDVVRSIDLAAGRMVVEPVEGLLS
jgi:16S rRNA processing protein RimM